MENIKKPRYLKKGDILYSIPIYTGNEKFTFEIFEINGIGIDYNNRIVEIFINIIIGDEEDPDIKISIPFDFDLNNIIFCYYDNKCTWAYTCNEQLAIEWYNRYLDNEVFRIDKIYDIWDNKWAEDWKIIYKSRT